MTKQIQYDESSIKVLEDREHVRLRPGMYVASERPTYQMFTEILDNGIDEVMNGHGDTVKVDIDYDKNEVRVEDNGRGLPQGMNKDLNKPTPIVIYTKLNSGGKYDLKAYGKSSGLHGVGSTVVNALSEWLKVETWRGQDVFNAEFCRGAETSHSSAKDPGRKGNGTIVTFKPDDTVAILSDTLKTYESDIKDRLSLLVTIVPGLKIIYNGDPVVARGFSTFIPEIKVPLLDDPITFEVKDLKVSINWSEDTNRSSYRAYCNTLFNPNGGDHEKAVYEAVVESLKNDDTVLGLNFSVSVMYPDVQYDGQAKLKASSKDMRQYVRNTLVGELKSYFRKNKDVEESIILLAKRKRSDINKRNNKSAVTRNRKSTFLNALGVAGFSDCTTKKRDEAELYIVEGESAAGSARQCRDVSTQAILPLRGKVINAHTADVAALLKNAEIGTLVSSIDAGIFDDLNVAKSRYGKIIIMTDADDDGKDIAASLIGFFVKCMPDLVEKGYVYLSLPPLYGTHVGGKFVPITTEQEKDDYLAKGHKITRYKGLGEMNPAQLKVACMDPNTREMIQLTLDASTKGLVAEVLGGDSSKRKQLLKSAGVLI